MKEVIIWILLTLSPALMAQQVISGRITDAEDGMPVAGASVFIANTTIGTASDASGNYSLTVQGSGSFEIVISHVGYQSVFYKIDEPKNSHQYDVLLKIAELEEITVKAAKTYRNSDVNLFWSKILGERPSKRGFEVLNPEKVYYYKSGHVLKAFCQEPIEIINHRMGYHIRYVLQSFEHDYRIQATTFYGMPFFEELIPRNDREEQQWAKKRKEVYAVSLNHFLRALYRRQIYEEGFLLVNQTQFRHRRISPVHLQDSLRIEQNGALLNITDSVLLLCYAKSVALLIQDINKTDSLEKQLKKSMAKIVSMYDYSYDHISEEDALDPDVQVILLPSQITIYPDGTYKGLLATLEVNKYVLGLSSMVPVEYPESSQDFFYNNTVFPAYDFGKVEENMTAQLTIYPQEKIHLHTDRDFYVPGEKIWFKAYVTDAHSHLYPTYTQFVYVELISPVDTLVSRVMIQQTNDMFYGHLPISNKIPEGDYTLRAYTRYMENMGDDYFFKKNIRIAGIYNYELQITNYESKNYFSQSRIEDLPKQITNYEKIKGSGEDFDVSFFPEGGNLVEGAFCKVAFKVLNKTGYPEAISGVIVDETNVEITAAKTVYAGMGMLGFRPEAGKRYRLKCTNENGMEKQFELPPSNPRAYAITTSSNNNNLYVDVQIPLSPFGEVQVSENTPLYLLAHCRGIVVHFSEWDREKKGIIFPLQQLPAGVIQLVLFDGQMNPLSERLVFNKNNATIPIEFQTDKEMYQIRDKVATTLFLTPSLSGRAGERFSHFSVAITDDKDIAVDESVTILSSLLLSSELKGYIENPAYYLLDNPASNAAMDLLMMTHGWRRYNIPEVVRGNPAYPQIPFQLSQEISGQVKSSLLSKPVANSEILVMMQDGGAGVTYTDKDGFFVVQDLEFPDSATFYVQALSKKGSGNLQLFMDDETFPKLVYAPRSFFLRPETKDLKTTVSETKDVFIAKAEQRAKYEADMWTIQLKEVEVTAPRIKKDEPRLRFWANQSSDKVITRNDIEKYQLSNSSISRAIVSLMAGTREVPTKGGSSVKKVIFRGHGVPLLVIDGIMQDPEDEGIWGIMMSEIESLDIFKGSSGIVLGLRGANGVISITTRRGENAPYIEKTNHTAYSPLGFQKPVEFYSPKYESFAARQSPIPDYRTTIFWKPDVVLTDDGEASFEFYTSDFPTTYSVVIEGLTTDGRIIRQVEKIMVSD